MTDLESLFLDEYFKVEKICKDELHCENGVTEYIAEMESALHEIVRFIPSWNDDLKQLKRCRHIRNSKLHENDSLDLDVDDLSYLQQFHQRLLNVIDPLAVYRSEYRKIQAQQMQNNQRVHKTQTVYLESPIEERPSFAVELISFVFLIIGVILFFAFKRNRPAVANSAKKGVVFGVLIRVGYILFSIGCYYLKNGF